VAALLHEPPLLVLDEPLNNLDPRSVRIVKELLQRYVARGDRGVLFSTHTMEVAEQLCHRVGILDRGELRGEGSLDELLFIRAGKVIARGSGTSLREGAGTQNLEEAFLTYAEAAGSSNGERAPRMEGRA